MSDVNNQCTACGAVLQPMARVCSKCGMAQNASAANPWGQTTQAPQYGQPTYGAPPMGAPQTYFTPGAAPTQTNSLAIASLVLSLVYLCGIGSILAVIFGIKARREIRASGGAQNGDGLALAGTIIGALGIVASVFLFLIMSITFLGTTASTKYEPVPSVIIAPR